MFLPPLDRLLKFTCGYAKRPYMRLLYGHVQGFSRIVPPPCTLSKIGLLLKITDIRDLLSGTYDWPSELGEVEFFVGRVLDCALT